LPIPSKQNLDVEERDDLPHGTQLNLHFPEDSTGYALFTKDRGLTLAKESRRIINQKESYTTLYLQITFDDA
jgi:hypothetical protein